MRQPALRQRLAGRQGLLVCDLLILGFPGSCRQPIWLAQQADQAAELCL